MRDGSCRRLAIVGALLVPAPMPVRAHAFGLMPSFVRPERLTSAGRTTVVQMVGRL